MQNLIQIRGTNGSGKTYIVYKLMPKFDFHPVRNGKGKTIGHLDKKYKFFLVGEYRVATGGADTIKSQDELGRIIRKALAKGYNVLFEGIIASQLAERYAKLYHEATENGVNVTYIFLNVPLDTCKANINSRRAKIGKPPTEAKYVEKTYTATLQSRKNLKNKYGVQERHASTQSKRSI